MGASNHSLTKNDPPHRDEVLLAMCMLNPGHYDTAQDPFLLTTMGQTS